MSGLPPCFLTNSATTEEHLASKITVPLVCGSSAAWARRSLADGLQHQHFTILIYNNHTITIAIKGDARSAPVKRHAFSVYKLASTQGQVSDSKAAIHRIKKGITIKPLRSNTALQVALQCHYLNRPPASSDASVEFYAQLVT